MKTPDTFEHDLLNLKTFSDYLTVFLDNEQHFVDGGVVAALVAPFGSGKSTFLRMWKSSLEEKGRTVVSLNSWESDYFGDPLFAIVAALLEQTSTQSTERIEKAVRKLGTVGFSLSKQLLKSSTAIDIDQVGQELNAQDILLADTFEQGRVRKKALLELKDALNKFLETSEKPVIFLVDELDRCRPDYAISYLEVIKHIFDIENAAFLLAFDKHQLANSAKHAFGNELVVEEYLRKFIHREIPLPRIETYEKVSSQYINEFLSKEGIRKTSVKADFDFRTHLIDIFDMLSPSLRQVQEVFRIASFLLQTQREEQSEIKWVYAATTCLLAALKVIRPPLYQQIPTSKMSLSEAYDLITEFSRVDRRDYWLLLFIGASGIEIHEEQRIEDALKAILSEDELEQFRGIGERATSMRHEWGYNSTYESKIVLTKAKLDTLDIWLR